MGRDDLFEFSKELDQARTRFGLLELGRKDFSGFKLPGVDFKRINLWGSRWPQADLRGADLSNVPLDRADLRGACLRGASLRGASLRLANLSGADLTEADLRGADLSLAKMEKTKLEGARLPEFQLCPPKGKSFRAWKKVRDGFILELEIPEDAERTSSLVSRKCRASRVGVVSASTLSGVAVTRDEYESLHDSNFKYRVGCVSVPRSRPYNDDIRTPCASGIHFFVKREEAAAYFY